MPDFGTLETEFNRFRDVRNNPRDGASFEQWETLEEHELTAWCEQLKNQGDIVIALFREMRECHLFGQFEEMKRFFRQDVTDLQMALRSHNVDLNFG